MSTAASLLSAPHAPAPAQRTLRRLREWSPSLAPPEGVDDEEGALDDEATPLVTDKARRRLEFGASPVGWAPTGAPPLSLPHLCRRQHGFSDREPATESQLQMVLQESLATASEYAMAAADDREVESIAHALQGDVAITPSDQVRLAMANSLLDVPHRGSAAAASCTHAVPDRWLFGDGEVNTITGRSMCTQKAVLASHSARPS